ncbi:MAG: hypothetical protein RL685_2299 [Pseudomonadota bacterium]
MNQSARKQICAAGAAVTVRTTQDLITQINAVNASSGTVAVAIDSTLTLQGQLPAINTAGTFEIGAESGSATLDGAGTYSGFVILSGTVSLSNLTIQNMKAQGANGCLGAGAGLLVANVSSANTPPNGNPYQPRGSVPNVTLSGVTFSNCQAIGGSGKPGGSEGAGGTGGVGGDTDGNSGGSSTATTLSGIGPLGTALTQGYFGVCGPDGAIAAGGPGGSYYNQGPIPGNPGTPGNAGGQGGFGAGAGAGGGGGGGGGGTGASFSAGGTGGGGAEGGSGGTAGFGGGGPGTSTSGTAGQPGTHTWGSPPADSVAAPSEAKEEGTGWPPWPAQYGTGGTGGTGGNGAPGGGGAALGGAIFVMGEASLWIEGTGTISGGSVTGGSSTGAGGNGCAAGAGIFLQGSGTLNVGPLLNETVTISDPIVDEAGAVATGAIASNGTGNGPDNLPAGGGPGTWAVSVVGDGTLALQGSHAFTGGINVGSGTLDLSKYAGGVADVSVASGATLALLPADATALQFASLTLQSSAALSLNGFACLNATTLNAQRITIAVEAAGFSPGVPVPLLTWTTPMSTPPTVTLQAPPDYHLSHKTNQIAVTYSPSQK